MNIIFWILIIIAAFLIWCCLANMFKIIGKWWTDMMNNVKNNINDDEEDK